MGFVIPQPPGARVVPLRRERQGADRSPQLAPDGDTQWPLRAGAEDAGPRPIPGRCAPHPAKEARRAPLAHAKRASGRKLRRNVRVSRGRRMSALGGLKWAQVSGVATATIAAERASALWLEDDGPRPGMASLG